MYGYAPTITELYKTEDETRQVRRKMFDSMDLKGTGVITIDEWPKFYVEHIIANAVTLAAHPIPRMYGYAPIDAELYKTEDEKEQARRKTFDFMDLKGTGVITVDDWPKFCVEPIITKVATFKPHLILDHGIEEEFKAFVKAALVRLMFSRDVSPPANADGGCHGAKEQDVSPPLDADNVARELSLKQEDTDLQGTLSPHGGQPDGTRNVSPPMDRQRQPGHSLSTRRQRSSRRRRRGDTGEETRR